MTTRADRGRPSEVLSPAVSGGTFFGPAVQVSDVLLFGETWSWWEALARSVLFAVGAGLALAASLRFSAAARERATVQRAVSTGVVPTGAGGEWLGRLTAERNRLRSNRSGVPSLSGLAAVLVAVVTLLPQGPGGWGWLLVGGLALAGGLMTVGTRRRLRSAERLLVELGERLTHA